MHLLKLKDLETGEIIERLPLDAKEIIANNNGRYCFLANAPEAAAQPEAGEPAPRSKRGAKPSE